MSSGNRHRLPSLLLAGAALSVLLVSGSFSIPAAAAEAAPSVTNDSAPSDDPAVAKAMQEVDAALKGGNVNLALVQLRNAVRLSPKNGAIRARLGDLLLRTGQAIAAERELRQARIDGAEDTVVVPGIMQAMMNRNESKELLAEFPDPPQGTHDPAAADILSARATALQLLGRTAEAKAAADRSLTLRRDASLLLNAARIAQQQNNPTLARSLTDEAVKLSPGRVDALVISVTLMQQAQETQKALATVDEFLKRDPKNILARTLRIGLLLEANDDAAAKTATDALIRDTPNYGYGIYYRAVLLARANDAKGAWQVAQALAPDFIQSDLQVATMVARIAAVSGNLESSGSILATAVARNPNAVQPKLQLAALRISQKSPVAALDTLAPLKGTTDPAVHALLAQAYLQLRRFNDAISSLEIASASGVGGDLVKRQLALTQLQTGSVDDALKELTDLSSRNPGDAQLAAPLIATLIQAGKTKDALAVADRLAKNGPKSALPDFYRGQILIAEDDLAGATKAFGAALAAEPKFIPALYYRANIALTLGNVDEANRDLEQVVTIDPANVYARVRMAEVALNTDRDQDAVASLNAAVKAAPNDATARLALANYYASRAKFVEALEAVNGLLRVSPNNAEALAIQGQIQLAQGKQAEAVTTFRSLAALNPQSPSAQMLLSRALLGAKDYPGAVDAAKKAIEIAPQLANARANLIDAHFNAGKPDLAIAEARRFAMENPTSQADLLLARTLLAAKRNNDAVAVLNTGLAKNPVNGMALQLARMHQAAGDPKKALAVLQTWLAKNPNDIAIKREYGLLLLSSGDQKAARQEFESFVKLRREDPVVLNNLAWLVQNDDPQRALTMVSLAARIAPKSAEIADTLGWMKYQQKDVKGALAPLQHAHNVDGNNAWISYHLAVVLDASGRRAEAKTLLQTALAGNPKFDDLEKAKQLLARW